MKNQLVELTTETALTVFTSDNGLDPYVQQVKDEVDNFEHDLSTGASRKRSASLAAKVAKIKVKLDGLGKDLVAEWKENSKKVDSARKKMRDDLDELKVIARKPLSDWEAEQERLEAEQQARLEAEMKAKEVERDHEIALFMNENIDRERAEEKERFEAQEKENNERIERERIEHEERIKAEAIKEQAAQAERDRIASAEREEEAKQAVIESKQAVIEAKQAAKQALIDAENKRIEQAKAAEEKRLADIEAAKQAEIQKQEQEKLQAAAEAARQPNTKHCATINRAVLADLIELGIDEVTAKTVIKAIAKNLISHTTINY